MTAARATRTKRGRGRRWAGRALVVLAVIVALAWFFRERIAAYAVRRAAGSAGIEVAWKSLEIDGLSRVRIVEASVRRPGDLDLAADRIEVELGLWRLVRGDLGGLESVRVERLRGFAGPFERVQKTGPRESRSFRMPSALTHLEITVPGLEVRVSKERRIELADLSLLFDGHEARCTARSLAWIDRGVRTEFPLDVRGAERNGRFEIVRAEWDPRIVLENARIDTDAAETGLVLFEGGVAAFGGRAHVQGRLDDGVVYLAGSVSVLDLDVVARAYAPVMAPRPAGRVDARFRATLPLADPLALELGADLVARDAHYVRSFDELSCHVQATPRGITLTDGLVVHGENAVRFEGQLPPLGTDPCAWLERMHVVCEGEIGDTRALLGTDVGLRLRDETRWSSTPVHVSAVYARYLVSGHVRASTAELGSIVSAFAGTSPATARVDLEADVALDIRRAAHVSVNGMLVAENAHVLGHPLDQLVADVRWDKTGLSLARVSAIAGANSVEADGVHVPRTVFGACGVEHVRDLVVSRVRAELLDLPAILRRHATDPTLERLSAHRLLFEGALAGGEITLERGDFETQAGLLKIERSRIPLSGSVRSILRDPALDLQLLLRFDDIAGVVKAVAPDAFPADDPPRGSVAGTAHVRGDARRPNAGLALTGREIFVRGAYFEELDVRADLDEKALHVEEAESRGSLGAFTLSGTYVFADERIVEARLEADLVDLSRLAPAHLPGGAVKASIRANGVLGAVDGSVSITGRDIVWKDVRLDELAIEAKAARGAWTVQQLSAVGHGLRAELAGHVSSLAPSAAERKIVLDTLTLSGADVGAALAAPATITERDGRWSVDGFALEGTAGNARVHVEHEGALSQLDVELKAPVPREILALAGIESGASAVDAAIHLTRQGRDIACRTHGEIATLDATDPAATRIRWRAELLDRRVTIEQFTVERGTLEHRGRASAAGSFPLDPLGPEVLAGGALDLRVLVDTPDLAVLPFVRTAWGVSGGGRLRAELGGAWTRVTGTLDARLDDAALSGVRGLAELGRVSGMARLAFDDSVRLDSADISVDRTVAVRAAGSLATPLDVRALSHGDLERYRNSTVDLAVLLDADDLGPIASRVPALRRTLGRAHAELRVAGTPAAPTYTGSATLEDGEIRTTTNLPSIVAVSSRVHFDGKELVVDALAGEMGGAPFTMQGKVGVIGEAPQIDLEFKGQSLLLWRERDVTVRADAELSLAGPLDALVLSGDLALRDGRFTKKFDFLALGKRGPRSGGGPGLRLFALEEQPFSNMRFDVNVETAKPFVIATNLVRGGVSPSLRLLGTGALPELRGSVLVEPSRVLLPSGTVRVRSGRIEFRADRPGVPDLDIQASARMQGYDIEVNISGSYDNPRVELSSVPPLPREDLALLLITGRPPGNSLSGAVGQRAALDLAVYIARDVAVAWLEADEEDVESLAERLEVVLGADTTKSGADAVLVRMRLSGDLQEKRRAIFATGERDVYDFYNFGVRFVFAFQ